VNLHRLLITLALAIAGAFLLAGEESRHDPLPWVGKENVLPPDELLRRAAPHRRHLARRTPAIAPSASQQKLPAFNGSEYYGPWARFRRGLAGDKLSKLLRVFRLRRLEL
jgi:hypothetical protein